MRNKTSWLFSILVFLLISICFLNFSKHSNYETSKPIKSNLSIPQESAFLSRQNLIREIDRRFKNNKDIQSIALIGIVGVGGIGKTTLARYYGRLKKNSPIVWELNAETKETLINSFEDFCYTAAKTGDQRKELILIQNIMNPEEKEKQLLCFVHKFLKNYPGWILIYDNVEDFSRIKDYFPKDANVWGVGKVIITTRDASIQHSNYISRENIIDMGELDPQEALTLFSKVLYNCTPEKLTVLKKKEALELLRSIPSFPLDISTAAHYIKNEKLSHNQYLQRIENFSEDFESYQLDLIRKTSNYNKTRYGIVMSSLKTLIQNNPEFNELLFFICLLDSQNIPIDLLISYKKEPVVTNFIEELKKNGFVISEKAYKDNKGIDFFSIHRCIQKIGISYLIKSLNIKRGSLLTKAIIKTLEDYIDNIIEKEDVLMLKFVRFHVETALSKKELLTTEMEEVLSEKLGEVYYTLCDYQLALNVFQKRLSSFSQQLDKNYQKTAETLVHLGSVYRELEDYTKAKELIEKGLFIYNSYNLENCKGFANALWSLSNVYTGLGSYEKAKELLERSLKIYNKYYPQDYRGLVLSMSYLGNVYRELGEYNNARVLLEQSLEIYKKYYPESYSGLARPKSYLGNVYLRLGKYENARDLLEQSLKIYKKHYPENHIEIAWVLQHLGNSYRKLENYEKAKDLLEQSISIYKKHYNDNHMKVAWAQTYLGNVYKELGHYKKAGDILKNCLEIYENNFGKDHIETARVLRSLGQIYTLENKMDLAEDLFKRGLSIFQKQKHADTHLFLESLGELYILKYQYAKQRGKVEEAAVYRSKAARYLQEALDLIRINFSETSPHFFKIKKIMRKITSE